ncbi:31813_t:CDS:1, partial [Racocetra persica]
NLNTSISSTYIPTYQSPEYNPALSLNGLVYFSQENGSQE